MELHFDPDDLSRIDVWCQGRRFGTAVPHVLRRDVRHQSPRPRDPPSRTAYLDIVERDHLGRLGHLDYRRLDGDDAEEKRP